MTSNAPGNHPSAFARRLVLVDGDNLIAACRNDSHLEGQPLNELVADLLSFTGYVSMQIFVSPAVFKARPEAQEIFQNTNAIVNWITGPSSEIDAALIAAGTTELPNIDELILVSGDSGFIPLLESARSSGVKTTVAALPISVSSALAAAADKVVDLRIWKGRDLITLDFASTALPPRNQYFVGREAEVIKLVSLLSSESPPPVLLITGLGGVGKTALAIEAAYRVAGEFPDGTIYVNLGGTAPNSFQTADLLGALLTDLNIVSSLPEPGEERVATFHSWLASRKALILLDDAGDESHIRQLLPGNSRSVVIITSRRRALGLDEATVMVLDVLPADASVVLLERSSGSTIPATEPDAAFALAAELGYLPLALDLAGRVIAQERITFTEYMRRLSEIPTRTDAAGSSVWQVIDLAYKRLAPLAARVIRRLSLVDEGEQIPFDLISFLLNQEEQESISGALDQLAELGLIYRVTNDSFALHAAVREFAKRLAAVEDPQDEVTAARDRARRYFLLQRGYRPQPEPLITRDYWTLNDELSYRYYGDAIAEFIRHRQTRPPLTIGLKAPWGAGKTSLMRMIQDNLDPQDGERPCRIRFDDVSRRKLDARRLFRRRHGVGSAESGDEVTNFDILREADTGDSQEFSPGRRDAIDKLRAGLAEGAPIAASQWRPTVWFNPWMYQSGEQIWAGLAYEIISQVTDRLPAGDRERFWLRLNLARVDRDAVRRRLYRLLAERILPLGVVWLVAVVLTLMMLAVGQLLPSVRDVARGVSATVLGSGTLALAIGVFVQVRSFLRKAATGPLASLVRQPDIVGGARGIMADLNSTKFSQIVPDPEYSSRLGFLHLVQTDMKRVLDLVATEQRPLVVLVDDLDRCSPGAVAQVIEAVNLFLAGEFPNCIFVLAMEPGAVAAHVEVAYKDLVAALREGRLSGDWSTLGWRFLEKIVQLPLSLPAPRADREIPEYLRSLIGLPPSQVEPTTREGVNELNSQITASQPAAASEPQHTRSELSAVSSATRRPDKSEVSAIEQAIRSRRPTPDTLHQLALEAQWEVLRQPAPLGASAFAAADRIFADLYSDIDAQAALTKTLPALSSSNPREIKRFVNLFRFYTFIVERQRLLGFAVPSQEQIAKLAAFAIRWPNLVSMFGFAEIDHPLATLERAARGDDDEQWTEILHRVFPAAGNKDASPDWSEDLRLFLRDGPGIGTVAAQLL